MMVMIFMLKQFISYVNSGVHIVAKAILFIFILSFVQLLSGLLDVHSTLIISKASLKVQRAFCHLLYKKSFKMNSESERKYKKNEINQLIQDSKKIAAFIDIIPQIPWFVL